MRENISSDLGEMEKHTTSLEKLVIFFLIITFQPLMSEGLVLFLSICLFYTNPVL